MRVARVDNNHAEVVAAFRNAGMTVQSLAAVGKGCPDLLVGFRGLNFLIEVKDGEKTAGNRPLTSAQIDWLKTWAGRTYVALDAEDAVRWVIDQARGFGAV